MPVTPVPLYGPPMIRHSGCCLLCLAACICLLVVSGQRCPAAAAGQAPVNGIVITADDQFAYASERFDQGDYDSAIVEFRRFVHFFPADRRLETAMFRMGAALFHNRAFRRAIREFQTITARYARTDPAVSGTAVEAFRMISRCHVELGQAGAAVINLRNLIALTDDPGVRDTAWYGIGWLYIEAAQWEKARAALDRISAAGRTTYRLERLESRLDRVDELEKKDPALAGLLSVVPGLGQLYCRRNHDALIAFLVNGALMAATYEAFDSGNEALGGVVGLVELGFYTGNIYGAANGARKYNRARSAEWIERLKSEMNVGLFPASGEAGVAMTFRYAF